ncbi:hypothetical protein OSH08_07910 [Kaistia geumhonensis]|uniref:Uncharacterized protein n=1 Tax=Kaistia geumhonensis TaxID=410839 RepID=A0ABU0M4H9_9HYPH|nr:hypothetical protein [Kaistia geumhonensis]MCX5478925.1 hypothetical protein [Kaistia geumhonensis]MDQ0515856.1 hypothetical protein [Kaistia geumhonensis]
MHRIGEFEVAYTGRNTWRAYIYKDGEVIDIAPVAWLDNYDDSERRIAVSFRKKYRKEMEERSASGAHFKVVVGEAAEPKIPGKFRNSRRLVKIVEVVSTGEPELDPDHPEWDQGVWCREIRTIASVE